MGALGSTMHKYGLPHTKGKVHKMYYIFWGHGTSCVQIIYCSLEAMEYKMYYILWEHESTHIITIYLLCTDT